jgi:lysophospholipase L1-like esterase
LTENSRVWFKNNSKKTLFLINIIVVILFLVIADKILEFIDPHADDNLMDYGARRHIILREHNPSTHGFVRVADFSLTDSLEDKEFKLTLDENGFIAPSKIHETSEYDIVFLGGSTTESLHIDEKNRFPYLVGRHIEKETSKKINSYNAGVSGNNTLHSINILLNKIVPLGPDAVVLMHNINDLTRLILDRTYWPQRASKGPIQPSYLPEEQTFSVGLYFSLKKLFPNILKPINQYFDADKKIVISDNRGEMNKIKLVGGEELKIPREKIVKAFSKNIQLFIEISRAYGIKPVLMTQANRFKMKLDSVVGKNIHKFCRTYSIPYERYKDIYDKMNQAIRDIAKNYDVPLIDLDIEVPQTSEYMYDPVHYNKFGSRYVSKLIARDLMHKLRI